MKVFAASTTALLALNFSLASIGCSKSESVAKESSSLSEAKDNENTPANTYASQKILTYTNKDGCIVEKEQRAKGVILSIKKDKIIEVIGFANDYSRADFVYCKGRNGESAANVNFFEGSKGTGLLISCSESQNDKVVTRGRADIDLRQGLTSVKIDGQVKGLLGRWKQDVIVECNNLTLSTK